MPIALATRGGKDHGPFWFGQNGFLFYYYFFGPFFFLKRDIRSSNADARLGEGGPCDGQCRWDIYNLLRCARTAAKKRGPIYSPCSESFQKVPKKVDDEEEEKEEPVPGTLQ